MVVKQMKLLMKKTQEQGADAYVTLLEWRNTPTSSGFSPAELMFGKLTKPLVSPRSDTRQPTVRNSERMTQAYNRHTKRQPFPELKSGELV